MSASSKSARLGAIALACALAAPAAADAAATSASFAGNVAQIQFDDAADGVTITEVLDGPNLVLSHGQTGGSFAGATDWDTATAGVQTVLVGANPGVVVRTGGGNDQLAATLTTTGAIELDAEAGDDTVLGSIRPETVKGGAGDDRLVAGRGDDTVLGGDGNDTLVWNNGDGTDQMTGEAGADAVEVNGSPNAGDVFVTKPGAAAGSVRFDRTNLGLFGLDLTTVERLQVNGLGGDDSITAQGGVGALIRHDADGGAGLDTLSGGDGTDRLNGGPGVDTLDGGAGDDIVVGDTGNDTMRGAAGDDLLIWRNGDGTDKIDGDDGADTVAVETGGGNDVFAVTAPIGGRTRIERTSAGPFALDVAVERAAMTLLAGNDVVTVDPAVGGLRLDADGGSGDDRLQGAWQAGDVLTGGPGNDVLDVRDTGQADVARCDEGTDQAVADTPDLALGCETVDAPPVTPVPGPTPVVTPPARKATASILGITRRTARIRVSCPATGARCVGDVSLATATPVRAGKVRVRLPLGSRTFTLAPGARRTVTVTLPTTGRALARRGVLRLRLTTRTDGAGATARTVSVRPK